MFVIIRVDWWRKTKLLKLWCCKLSENKPGQKWHNHEIDDQALNVYPCSVELHQSPRKWGRGLLSQQIPKFTRCCRRTRSLMSHLDSRLHSGCFRRFLRRVQIQVLWATSKSFFVELKCYWNTVSTVFCRRLWQTIGFPKCESSCDEDWIICGECTEAAHVWQVWIWDCVSSFNREHLYILCMVEFDQSHLWLRLSLTLVKTAVNLSTCG